MTNNSERTEYYIKSFYMETYWRYISGHHFIYATTTAYMHYIYIYVCVSKFIYTTIDMIIKI